MVKLWAYKVKNNVFGTTLGDVPERYLDAVKKELGIEG